MTAGDGTENAPTGLVIVGCLAALAGAVDASGLSLLKDLYVSFMSGNTTSLGVAIAAADWQRVSLIAGIVATFVAGAACGTVIAHLAGRYHLSVVILVVAAMLTLPLVAPVATVLSLTFAMGALNAAMQHAGRISVSVTYVTGSLVKFGQGLGRLLCGAKADPSWLAQAVPWSGLLFGAAAAAAALTQFGQHTFAALPVAAALIASAASIAVRTRIRGTA